MKNVLVPTDFSANSWNALEYAVGLFEKVPCNFYILHIGRLNQSSTKGNSFTLPLTRDNTIRKKLSVLFERIEQLPRNRRHHFVALEEYGRIVNAIRNTVASKSINLIVMGTKGASGVKAAIVGSNTGNVITQVACNVLVVPEQATIVIPPKEIVFPTDYNIFYSFSILEAIAEIIHLAKAKLQILNVLKNKGRLSQEQEKNKAYLQDYVEEAFQEKHRFYDIRNNNVKTAIQHHIAIEHGEMVIMVAKNLDFLQNLFFDSTIEKVSFHTRVPLLVLHE
ncbi:MAG: universal stress protein [Maribacter sp.]|uniref:universal stress protein n=1 Tax=Maribacter sp. TaxID=1897614 RepID=UPI0032986FBA